MSEKKEKKVLTRESYAAKFKKLMENFNYISQDGEVIIQCKPPYRPYWFVSNKGYIFSVYTNSIRILKLIYSKTGKKNKDGNRNGQSWRVASVKGIKHNIDRFDIAKIVTEHFLECEFDTDEKTEIHHIQKRNSFTPEEGHLCNRADNLQILPKSIHKELTHYASKTNEEIDEELWQKIKKSGCPVYQFTEEQLEMILINAIRNSLANGVEPIMYTTTITNDVSEIKAEARPITSIEII